MSRKSSKPKSFGNPGSIANAMYDAQKKEINGSIAFGASFIGAGVIAAAIGILKYLDITGKVSEQAEAYDAWAWLIIAGVGILVGVIGFISIMKSLVSLGQIGSWAKEAESHASPFQGQKLNRKVAAMNQAQAMNKPDMQGMAEEPGERKKRGFFKRGKETKKKNNDDLYYKYNPQEKRSTSPPKAAPVMEQKFDYGINEEKELTFADEFLMKNKRDPFAQYRKDLGIQEEVKKKEVEQKPQFIRSARAVAPAANSNPAPAKPMSAPAKDEPTERTLLDLSEDIPSGNSKEVGFDLSLKYFAEEKEKAAKNSQTISDGASKDNRIKETSPDLGKTPEAVPQTPVYEAEQRYTPSDSTKDSSGFLYNKFTETEVSHSTSEKSDILGKENTEQQNVSSGIEITYGDHNAEDDDMFFSVRSSPASASQSQSVQVQTQTQSQPQRPRDEAPVSAASSSDEPKSAFSNFNKLSPPTVMLDLDYEKDTKSEAAIKPDNSSNSNLTTTDPNGNSKPESAFSNFNKKPVPTVGLDLDYEKSTKIESKEGSADGFYSKATTTTPNESSKPESAFSNFNKTPVPTVGLDLDYEKETKSEIKENSADGFYSKTTTTTPNESSKPESAFSNFNKKPAPTVGLDINYKNNDTSNDYDFSLFGEVDSKHYNSAQPQTQGSGTPVPQQFRSDRNENIGKLSEPVKGIGSEAASPSIKNFDERNNGRKKSEEKNTKKETEKKKSFSERYLNKDKNKKQEAESKIIKNGTRSQRKFVDASEYDEWTCSQCGKVNQEYVGVCACGARKPRAKKH